MDWRRTLPVLVVVLNAWIALGFLPAVFLGPVAIVFFAGLMGVGVLAGVTQKGEPTETEQNALAIGLIVVLAFAVALALTAWLLPGSLDAEAVGLLAPPLWALASGYATGRFWSVPPQAAKTHA